MNKTDDRLRPQTIYEWCVEMVEDGDIQGHHHEYKLSDIPQEYLAACELYHDNGFTGKTLVLIKDVGSEANGLQHRAWAYTQRINGKLEFIEPLMDDGKPIPKQYIDELAKAKK